MRQKSGTIVRLKRFASKWKDLGISEQPGIIKKIWYKMMMWRTEICLCCNKNTDNEAWCQYQHCSAIYCVWDLKYQGQLVCVCFTFSTSPHLACVLDGLRGSSSLNRLFSESDCAPLNFSGSLVFCLNTFTISLVLCVSFLVSEPMNPPSCRWSFSQSRSHTFLFFDKQLMRWRG